MCMCMPPIGFESVASKWLVDVRTCIHFGKWLAFTAIEYYISIHISVIEPGALLRYFYEYMYLSNVHDWLYLYLNISKNQNMYL